jgi:4'-phosphopantetheinyl transferase
MSGPADCVEVAALVESPTDELVRHAAALCHDDELARAARFASPGLRARWLLGRAWVRTRLAATTGQLPHGLHLGIEPEGRPSLDGGPELSIAHSERLVALAVAGAPVGVDVEPVLRDTDERGLALVLSAAELATAGRRPEGLLTAWTRKEALAKWRGTGLTEDLTSVTTWPWPERGLPPLWSTVVAGHHLSVAGIERTAIGVRSLTADLMAVRVG